MWGQVFILLSISPSSNDVKILQGVFKRIKNMITSERIKKVALSSGLDMVGIATADSFKEYRQLKKYTDHFNEILKRSAKWALKKLSKRR